MKRALIASFASLSLLAVPAVAATSSKPTTSVKADKKAAKAEKKAAKAAAKQQKAAAKTAGKSK